MEALWKGGATIHAFDPEAMAETQRIYGARDDLNLYDTKELALEGADALVIVTEWQEFKAPNFELIKQKLKYPLIFDGRNLFDPKRVSKKGIKYHSIGRSF